MGGGGWCGRRMVIVVEKWMVLMEGGLQQVKTIGEGGGEEKGRERGEGEKGRGDGKRGRRDGKRGRRDGERGRGGREEVTSMKEAGRRKGLESLW